MAQTFKPYQSVGQGLNPLKLPQGYALQESKNTMNVLSQGLNRMSDFAFKQASVFAQIEGEKWGVENAPTLKDVKQANKLGDDPFSMFDNSVFGRTARASALKVLENEIIVTGTKTMNDLVYNAEKNSLHPNDLNDGLNAHIMGLIEPIAVNSPALASKLKAQFLLKGAEEFDKYRSAHAKATATSLGIQDRKATNLWLSELSSGIFNTLYNENQFTNEKILSQKDILSLMLKNPSADYTKAEVEAKIKNGGEFDKAVVSFLKDKIYEQVLTMPLAKQNEMLNKILDGDATGNGRLDNALKISPMNSSERENIVNSLSNHIQRLKNDEDWKEQVLETERLDQVEETKKAFRKATKGEINYEEAKEAINKMYTLDHEEGDKLNADLDGAKGGKYLETDYNNIDVRVFLDRFKDKVPTYEDLENISPLLSQEEYEKWDKIIDLHKDKRMKIAMGDIEIATKYDPTAKLIEDDEESELRKLKYKELKMKLERSVLEATANNIDLDIEARVAELTEGVAEELDGKKKELDLENLKSYLNTMFKPNLSKWLESPPEEDLEIAQTVLLKLKSIKRQYDTKEIKETEANRRLREISPAVNTGSLLNQINRLKEAIEAIN